MSSEWKLIQMDKPYYLAIWKPDRRISAADAARQYSAFTGGSQATDLDGSALTFCFEFVESVYHFYCELVRHFPEVEMISDQDCESSPWACTLDLSEGHIIIALIEKRVAEVMPVILNLANVHGLTCYDPQAQKVHQRIGRGRQLFLDLWSTLRVSR
jgi:hypothetical protein